MSKEGVKKNPAKVEVILELPKPRNVSEVRAFVGMVSYYPKSIPNLSSLLAPLYRLLQKGVEPKWDRLCEKAFNTEFPTCIYTNVYI